MLPLRKTYAANTIVYGEIISIVANFGRIHVNFM